MPKLQRLYSRISNYNDSVRNQKTACKKCIESYKIESGMVNIQRKGETCWWCNCEKLKHDAEEKENEQ